MTSSTKLLVERGEQLKLMRDAVERAQTAGQLLLVEGEAGHGKTSLIEAFESGLDHRHTTLVGACDPVSVPTPFAPFYEMLSDLPEDLADQIVEGSGRHGIYSSLLSLIAHDPTVMILEDLHWADEASLGLVRYLGRRIEKTRSLLVLSYRPEEIDTTHPLLVVLAGLGSMATKVRVSSLSLEGVGEVASGLDVDPKRVHAATLGNPFFVEEILANPGEQLPGSIESAVMASVAQLPTGALDLLEMVALSPEGLDLAIAEGHSPEAGANIDACVQRRLLVEESGRLRCRHDLIRMTVDKSVPPARRRRIHIRLLEVLESANGGRATVARLAHHSVEARVEEKAIDFSLEAAAIALADGANRQARHHYESALRFRDAMDNRTLDEALLGAANVHCSTNFLLEAANAADERIAFSANDHDLGVRHASAAFFAARWGNTRSTTEHAEEAVRILSAYPPSEALVQAMGVKATLALWNAQWSEAAQITKTTMEMATELGSSDVRAGAHLLLGRALFNMGDSSWEEHVRRGIDLAIKTGDLETASSGMNTHALVALWNFDLDVAFERFRSGAEFALANEMDAWYVAMMATTASCELSRGQWDDAAVAIERALGWPTCASTECESRILSATLMARRGDPGATSTIHDALLEVDRLGTYSERVTGGLLAYEAAWLGLIDIDDATERYSKLVDRFDVESDPHSTKRFELWFALLDPDSHAAYFDDDGSMWATQGFAYEAALVSAMKSEPPLEEVFSWLEVREADGVADALRKRLRVRGFNGIPRGVRASTANNPAGLTSRQIDVLTLLAMGHTNGRIADELFISEKTVGHHVSAILDKLDVDNRGQAAAKAAERGLV